MKVWITKYALSTGIYTREAERCTDFNPDMVAVRDSPHHEIYHGEGKDWHQSWQKALVRAEQMRTAKIKSLNKQLAKLEAMDFVPQVEQAAE